MDCFNFFHRRLAAWPSGSTIRASSPPAAITDEDGRTRYSLLGSIADPKINVRYGIAYLKRQIGQFGMTPAALRAYNRHPARASEAWPEDRYAEDVALRYFTLVQRFE